MSNHNHEDRKYLLFSVVVLTITLISAAMFNFTMDPYLLFGTRQIDGFNKIKPAAGRHIRISKPYMAERAASMIVIGGNSRPELGLDPSNTCLRRGGPDAFNIGIPGAGLYMQGRMLQHAIATNGGNGKKTIYWGIDFLDFLSRRSNGNVSNRWPPATQEFDKRLLVSVVGEENPLREAQIAKDFLTTLFSINTVEDSIYTLASRNDRFASTRRGDGFNPARDYLKIIATEGQSVLFTQKNRELARIFSNNELRLLENDGWSMEFETLSQMLDYFVKRNVQVILFINPYHIDYLSLIYLSGRWDEFETWKRILNGIAQKQGIELWDFSLVNRFTTERLEVAESGNRALRWFWEPAHYKAEYGELMASYLSGGQCKNAMQNQVGSSLDHTNISSHLQEQRQRLKRYIFKNQPNILRLSNYIPKPNPKK